MRQLNGTRANFHQQLVFRRKVGIDKRLGHLQLIGHLLQGGFAITLAVEKVNGRRHNTLALELRNRLAHVLGFGDVCHDFGFRFSPRTQLVRARRGTCKKKIPNNLLGRKFAKYGDSHAPHPNKA